MKEDVKQAMTSIATFYCKQKNRYDLPRQGVLHNDENQATIHFHLDLDLHQAFIKLADFERVWLIFGFHLNEGYKAMVSPPAHTEKKVGLFASRSPYRPNGLGLSCVKLESVNATSKKIFVSEYDIIDGSPIYDIKPYLPYCDSFADAKVGWVASSEKLWQISYSKLATKQILWLKEHKGPDLKAFIKQQLAREPTSRRRKRIYKIRDSYKLAYRTWRALFTVDDNAHQVNITEICSDYSNEQLHDGTDIYEDKELHRRFIVEFSL